MLKSLQIRHFHSCKDVLVDDIGESLLLVGPNNAGKTTILKALCWARDVAMKGGLVNGYAFFHASSVEVEFALQDCIYRYSVAATTDDTRSPFPSAGYAEKLSSTVNGVQRDIVIRNNEELIHVADGKQLAYSVGRLDASLAFLSKLSGELGAEIRTIISFLGNINYYALESISGEVPFFINEEMLTAWKTETFEPNAAHECLMKLVDLWLHDSETFDEVKEVLGPKHLNLIDDISVENKTDIGEKLPATGKGNDYAIFFHTSYSYAYYEDLSFGTKRILQIVIAMLYKSSSVLLFEQPEDGIHPGLLSRLTGVLLSYVDPMQLILTSHSPSVINVVGAHDIRLIEAPEGTTQVHALSADEIAKAEKYVDETGQLADYIRLLES
jgi:hypothetical protein